jgi:hypothetical protein
MNCFKSFLTVSFLIQLGLSPSISLANSSQPCTRRPSNEGLLATTQQKFLEQNPQSAAFEMGVQSILSKLDSISDEELKAFFLEVRKIKNYYISIDRSKISSAKIYENEYLLRFMNERIVNRIEAAKQKGQVEEFYFEPLLAESQIYSNKTSPIEIRPNKTLSFYGTKASDIKLEDWIDDPEFSRYDFKDDSVNFRGLTLKPGDVILNHPTDKPGGTFTSLAKENNSFSHAAIVVFLNREGRKIPIVIDEHERGARAVPLSVYLSPQVVSYAEIFRTANDLWNKTHQIRLNEEANFILNMEFPYDLTGSTKSDALSCVELVNLLYQLCGLKSVPVTAGFSNETYKNIMRFGKIKNDFVTPTQLAMSPYFKNIGYIDNKEPLSQIIANEIILKVFRDRMAHGVLKAKGYPFAKDIGLSAIEEIHNPRSVIGDVLLSFTGFRRSNFPRGSKELLVSVNNITEIIQTAFSTCNPKDNSDNSDSPGCRSIIEATKNRAFKQTNFSMLATLNDPALYQAAEKAMQEWVNLFE